MIILRGRLYSLSRFSSAAPSSSNLSAAPQEVQGGSDIPSRVCENGSANITSINAITGERSIVNVSVRPHKPGDARVPRFRREFVLPQAARDGLRDALMTCNRNHKQLQHEADQLNDMLSQRRFPASPTMVKQARDKIRAQLQKKMKPESAIEDDLFGEKFKEARAHQFRHEVDKLMKKNTPYTWKPLDVETKEAAASYSLARIAPNYAEVSRVLEEFAAVDGFTPRSVLDYGSGCGSAFWAVRDRFGPAVQDYTMVDISDPMTNFAMEVMRDENGEVPKHVNFRRHLIPSLQHKYDVVVVHRTLCEVASEESRLDLLASLWKRTNRFLVLIESGLTDSYEALMQARDYLLSAGTALHLDETLDLLKNRDLLTHAAEKILHDDRLTEFERYSLIKDMVPESLVLPTALDPATVLAPCPHDLGCPLRGKSACTFSVRWRTLRADGKKKKTAGGSDDGTEKGKFSFVILEKGHRKPQESLARILKSRKMNGHTTCDLCTSFRGVQRVTLSKRYGELYRQARLRREGEIFPLVMTTQATEAMFDVFDLAKESIGDEIEEFGRKQ